MSRHAFFKRWAVLGGTTLALALGSSATWAEQYTVGFVPKLVGIPYFAAMKQGMDKAGKQFDMKIVYQGPSSADVAQQVNIVSSLINQGVDAIGVAANSPTAFGPMVKKARDKNIVFYSTDSQVDADGNQLRVSQVNDKALGYKVIDVLAAQLKANTGKTSGKVAFVSGGSTATNLNTWIKFMKARLADKYPDIELVDVQYGGEDVTKATNITNQLISAYPDLDGIVGVNTTSVPGAAQAVLTSGKKGQIAVTGITDPNTIRPYVMNGTVNKVVLWNPIDLGYLTGWGVKQLLEGKSFKPVNDVPGLGKVKYDEQTKTLLLGPPMVIDKSNIQMDF
ncbi:autoinducer 2 ABC transporter substrate-binding protein [Salinisphaera sp. Q1T1-3]|uniref:autoinducer 2 ABC transporter substrate-binding protein n=1 Tax=Salinisphaera sp. Q1T1-3 TaxID=2321229 RepID=UPI000E76FAD7|nr:autoinducer 2 ABC transporter substrate-binding protein [Salinisphaera sp. Q1T1-3]RJS91484.1 autoinducer 2 ABC transporter substrate-binding protein [Salinisphaera sp. Q1T1-3]